MPEPKQLLAPAKINLRLEVLGRLQSGYHQLRMFNITISLHDLIELEFLERGIEIRTDDPSLPTDQRNTVFQAIAYFSARFGIRFGVKVKIQKRIPAGAGLAGGSSDAATVLRALLDQFGFSPADLDLEELAYRVGADVPYLLFGGPAWVEGIGEKVEPVPDIPPRFFLLAKPGFSSSTQEVYQSLRLESDLTIEPKEVILSSLKKGKFREFCVNHLESTVFARHRGMEKLKSELIRLGASAAVMSGSGSTLVGIFSTWEQAELGGKELGKSQPDLWVDVVKQDQPGSARK